MSIVRNVMEETIRAELAKLDEEIPKTPLGWAEWWYAKGLAWDHYACVARTGRGIACSCFAIAKDRFLPLGDTVRAELCDKLSQYQAGLFEQEAQWQREPLEQAKEGTHSK